MNDCIYMDMHINLTEEEIFSIVELSSRLSEQNFLPNLMYEKTFIKLSNRLIDKINLIYKNE